MELLRPSLLWCFPIRGPEAAAAAKASAAAGEKVAKIHRSCHSVFPSGDQQQQQQKHLQRQEEKVAKMHSDSKRKKPPKSSFSMGSRSYVRHFRGALLELLRASLPLCFPIRGPAAAAKASAAAGGKGSQTSYS